MLRKGNIALLALAAACAALAGEGAATIDAYQKLGEEVRTGGQPTLEDLDELKAEGIKVILNLRRPSEHDATAEAARAEELGMRYLNVPVETASPKEEQADEFRKLLADPENRPVFIHCGSANRVGAFWMIHRVLDQGWQVEDAEVEAKRIGLRSENLREFARDYIRTHGEKAE